MVKDREKREKIEKRKYGFDDVSEKSTKSAIKNIQIEKKYI